MLQIVIKSRLYIAGGKILYLVYISCSLFKVVKSGKEGKSRISTV